ncbi:MAG: hypothetical protein GKS01_16275 [Alphaproteobacteria bacterium]|nr:hypothetical protein [Alphaproteobacteria bacterium]
MSVAIADMALEKLTGIAPHLKAISELEKEIAAQSKKIQLLEKNIKPKAQPSKLKLSLVSAREATARAHWVIAYTMQMLISFMVVVGAVWAVTVSMEDQEDDKWISSFILAGFLFGVWAVGRVLESPAEAVFATEITVANGSLKTWIPMFANPFSAYVETVLEKDFLKLISRADTFLTVALFGLAAAVASSLFLRDTWEQGKSSVIDEQQYLTRCFERLRLTVYMAAALLTTGVFYQDALLKWPISLLKKPGVTEAKNSIQPLLNGYVDELVFGYAVFFSIFLATILLVAGFILRKRAWKFVRVSIPNKTISEHRQQLTKYGLDWPMSAKIGQFIAVLAPVAAAGSVGKLTSAFATFQ